MSVKLKNLNKSINKIKRKVTKMLTSGTVPNSIGDEIRDDVISKASEGKITNGKGGFKQAPKLTKATQRVYRSLGKSTDPRFKFDDKLLKQIKTVRIGNKICIGPSTEDAARKVQRLNSSRKKNGKPKKKRPIMGWTKSRTKIIRNIIRAAISRNFN